VFVFDTQDRPVNGAPIPLAGITGELPLRTKVRIDVEANTAEVWSEGRGFVRGIRHTAGHFYLGIDPEEWEEAPHCGDAGRPCCEGNLCIEARTACVAGMCEPCGGIGDSCCDDGSPCEGDAVCDASDVCDFCGKLGSDCCPDGSCFDVVAESQGGSCAWPECGTEGRICSQDGSSDSGLDCRAGYCRSDAPDCSSAPDVPTLTGPLGSYTEVPTCTTVSTGFPAAGPFGAAVSWNAVPDADAYEIKGIIRYPFIANTTSQLIVSESYSTRNSSLTFDARILQHLVAGGVLCWEVRALNDCGVSDWTYEAGTFP
jgi:hypothetical protein